MRIRVKSSKAFRMGLGPQQALGVSWLFAHTLRSAYPPFLLHLPLSSIHSWSISLLDAFPSRDSSNPNSVAKFLDYYVWN